MARKRRNRRKQAVDTNKTTTTSNGYKGLEPEVDVERKPTRSLPKQKSPAPAKIITVASGKGGVGSSLFVANASIYLAQMGNRVVLVDADLGAGNLHTILGLGAPEETLADFIEKKTESIVDLIVETRVPQLSLIPGARDPACIRRITQEQRRYVLTQLSQIEADYIVVDAGGGPEAHCLDFFLASESGVVVLVPEPTAVESTYRFLRDAFFRKVLQKTWSPQVEEVILRMQQSTKGLSFATPKDLYDEVKTLEKEAGSILAEELWQFRPALLLNQSRTRSDIEVIEAMRSASWRCLGIRCHLLGQIDFDDAAWISIRRCRPLLQEDVDAVVSRQIEQTVHSMLAAISEIEQESETVEEERFLPSIEKQNYYDILELQPGATEEEIRRAHKKMQILYNDNSIGLYGLFELDELDKIQHRLTEGYECLMDLEQRCTYDATLFPEGHPGRVRAEEAYGRLRNLISSSNAEGEEDSGSIPQEVLPTPEGDLNGEWLKSVREARGVALIDIAAKTKISLGNLQWIEEEAFEKMSAPVYVRGFVLEYARYLKLDAEYVARVFVDRYRDWLDSQATGLR